MFNLSKKSVVLFLILIAVAIATGWFLVREAKKTGESFSEVGFIHVNVKKPVDDTNLLDTSKWQLQETDFFSVRFPQVWYWKQNPEGMGNNHAITSDRHFDIIKYPELGILDDVAVIDNQTDILISFYAWPTLQSDDGTKSTDIIIQDRIKTEIENVQKHNNPSAQCTRLEDEQIPFVLVCSYIGKDQQLLRKYFVINRQDTVLLRVQKNEKNESIPNAVFDEIAKSVSLKH